MFALAAGVSDYFDNRWYLAVPIISLALLDGFGGTTHTGSPTLSARRCWGAGTMELLRWRIFAGCRSLSNRSGGGGPLTASVRQTFELIGLFRSRGLFTESACSSAVANSLGTSAIAVVSTTSQRRLHGLRPGSSGR